MKRSKGFLFQPNGRADRASSSALRHIHSGPTAHGRQSMGGLGQQQDPPMTKLRRHCGTVYQGLASVCGSVAIHGVAAGPIRIFPVQIVELARRIGRHKRSDSRRPAKRILEQGNARSGWVRRSQGFGTLHRSGSRPGGNSRERQWRQAPQVGPHADASRVQRNMRLLDFETPDASVILTVLLTLDVRPGFRYGQRACGQGPAGRSYEAWVTPQPC